jgi:NAD(P)-dependent dehydrogenase (short-subunit alcohol dehydrogenase family)
MMGARSGASTQEVFAGWKLIPLGRLGTLRKFASVMTFLAPERASYVNEVSLAVDGGATCSLL